MLRLPPFTYEPATSAQHAAALLRKYGADALPVSAGTDLYANMKQRLFTPKVLVGLRSIPGLRFIVYNDVTGLTLGALCTLADVAESPVVCKYYPALAAAAASISTPPLRNMGTLGGNVCVDTRCNYYNQNLDWRKALGYCMKKDGDICRVALSSPKCVAVNSSDTAPVLQAFRGVLHLSSADGERDVPVDRYYINDGINAWNKQPAEIVTKVSLPPPKPRTGSAYRKLRLRNSFDFPILGVAVVLQTDGNGVCCDASIVLNAVASKPLAVEAAAKALTGSRLESGALHAAAEATYAAGRPLDNTSGSIPYRKRMIRVIALRALQEAAALAAA